MASSKWREIFLILLLSFPFIFWGVGAVSLLDPDEGMYGAIAREMAEKGDWITPHFDGVRYLEKPPLYFWLTALTISLVGPSEWAVRLWSALPALGTALLIWRMGRLLYGGASGLLSAIILLTSVGVFRYTRVAATDSLLVFSLTLSLYGFARIMLNQMRGAKSVWSGPLLFYLGMALGVLSKGLIGALFPLLIVGLYFWFSGERVSWNRIHFKWGLLLIVVLILPWHLLVAWKNPGFLQFYFVDNQFLRFLSDRAFIEDDVPVGSVAFLALTFVWFFPWSLFLWGTWRHGFPNASSGQNPEERLHLLVGLWVTAVIGFFFLSPSRLEHYILPALPPLSLVVGASWCDAFGEAKPRVSLKWPLVASAVGCGLTGIALILWADRLTPNGVFSWLAELNVYYRILKDQSAAFPFASVAPFVLLARGLGVALAIGLPLALVLFLLRKPLASFLAVTGVAAGIALLILRLLVVIEPHHSAKPVALALKARTQQGDLIVHEGSLEYSGSLPFYTGRQVHILNGQRGDLDFGSRYPEGQGLFLDDAEFTRLWEGGKRVFLVTREVGREGALWKLSRQPLYFLGRYGSRSLYSNHGP